MMGIMWISLVRLAASNRRTHAAFRTFLRRFSEIGDSLAEGSEFEPPVPVSELSDDSIMLEFATARRIALIARRLQCGRCVLEAERCFRKLAGYRAMPILVAALRPRCLVHRTARRVDDTGKAV